MKSITARFWFILLFFVCLPHYISADQKLSLFKISSGSALLIDADTGETLYSQNPNLRIQPASLAKVMNLFIVFDALKKNPNLIDRRVDIGDKVVKKGGSTMYLRVGQNVPLGELIKGVAVVSGNDSSLALSEEIYISEAIFVERMNQKVQELNLKNTKFQTVDGWPAPDQYTTAYDMAMIAQAYIREHPEALEYHKLKEFTHDNIVLHNRNGLVFKDPSVDGLKTGYIEEAGYHLIATAKRENRRLIAVVMGSKSEEVRENETLILLNHGFNNFIKLKLFNTGEVLTYLTVTGGVKDRVGLLSLKDGIVTVPTNQKEHVSFSIMKKDKYESPIQINQRLGDAVISDQNTILKTIPLYAIEGISIVYANIGAPPTSSRIQSNNSFYVIISVMIFSLIILLVLRINRQRKEIQPIHNHDGDIIKKRLHRLIET